MRQGKTEAIQDYTNREGMMSLPLQNSTTIALDETMRGSWPDRTLTLSQQEIAGSRISTEGSKGLSAVKKAIVARRIEEVRDARREQEPSLRQDGSAGDNFHTHSQTVRETQESLH